MKDPEDAQTESIRKLIRLKRYEQPPEGYLEGFLVEFQKRQRSELLSRSARSIFCERFATYWGGFGPQKWFVGAGVAYAAFMIGYYVWPSAADSAVNVTVSPDSAGTLWGKEIQIEVLPAEYLHPVLNEKAVKFEPIVLPVSFETSFEK